MRLSVYRSTSNCWGEHIEFNGGLRAIRQYVGGQPCGYIEVSFSTDKPLGKSSFTMAIDAPYFHELALEMVKADPDAAVKAFGAALQEVHAVHPPKPEPKPQPVAKVVSTLGIKRRPMNAEQTTNTAETATA
jgi:hypothetical protein